LYKPLPVISRVGFFPERDVLPGNSIFDAVEQAASASKTTIVIISGDFHRDRLCQLLLGELMMTQPLFGVGSYRGSYDRRGGRQLIVPVVRDECQLPFGLMSAELLRCRGDDAVQPADMLRLRRLLE